MAAILAAAASSSSSYETSSLGIAAEAFDKWIVDTFRFSGRLVNTSFNVAIMQKITLALVETINNKKGKKSPKEVYFLGVVQALTVCFKGTIPSIEHVLALPLISRRPELVEYWTSTTGQSRAPFETTVIDPQTGQVILDKTTWPTAVALEYKELLCLLALLSNAYIMLSIDMNGSQDEGDHAPRLDPIKPPELYMSTADGAGRLPMERLLPGLVGKPLIGGLVNRVRQLTLDDDVLLTKVLTKLAWKLGVLRTIEGSGLLYNDGSDFQFELAMSITKGKGYGYLFQISREAMTRLGDFAAAMSAESKSLYITDMVARGLLGKASEIVDSVRNTFVDGKYWTEETTRLWMEYLLYSGLRHDAEQRSRGVYSQGALTEAVLSEETLTSYLPSMIFLAVDQGDNSVLKLLQRGYGVDIPGAKIEMARGPDLDVLNLAGSMDVGPDRTDIVMNMIRQGKKLPPQAYIERHWNMPMVILAQELFRSTGGMI